MNITGSTAPNHQTAYPSNGSDYLDDVAKFLYDEDLLPASVTTRVGFLLTTVILPAQNVKTYTIGFDIDHKLLSDAADTDHGQGHYFTTQDNISLSDIFERIIGSILEGEFPVCLTGCAGEQDQQDLCR